MSSKKDISAVVGIGTDITDVKRIESLINEYGDAFLSKTFTEREIQDCKKCANSAQKFAARFAAKEAMSKALSTGIRGKITLKSLSVINGELGEPIAVLDEHAQAQLEKIGAKKMLISLSHLKEYAQAFAIATR